MGKKVPMTYRMWYGVGPGDTLKRNFISPPREYSLFPFWSWNDTLDADNIRFQIDEMLDKGVFGAFMHARVGLDESKTPYFSRGWWSAIKAAVEYGSKKKFYTLLYDENTWPSGSAGGRVVASNPEFVKKGLKVEKWEIAGPQDIKLAFTAKPLAIFAVRFSYGRNIDPETILDLTEEEGRIWAVPAGEWSIMAFIEVRGKGVQIDYLKKEAVARFLQITHDEYYRRVGQYFGKTIPGIFFDEIHADLEGTEIVWTDSFLQKFRQIKGYDLRSNLPLLIYYGGEKTPKVRCDYFDVFSTLYTEAWFAQIAEWCGTHGIWLTGHTIETIRDYRSQGNYFRTWVPVQIPGTDNEDYRYSFPRRVRWFKPKQLSSLCHVQGKRRAMVEALGGGGWVIPLEEYKIGLSLLGVYGLNFFVPHLFSYSTDRPQTMDDFPPSWFFQNPYWKYFKKLADFARRVSYMGTQGKHVCDVAILYPITTLHAQGVEKKDDVGTLGGGETGDVLEVQYNGVQEILLENLIDYDILDPEAMIQSEIRNAKITIADEKYAVVILPPLTTVGRDVAKKLSAFIENGGAVIALNTLPTASADKGENDGYVIQVFKEIFGFDPRSMRIGYHEFDASSQEEFIGRTNARGGRAFFTKHLEHVPEIIASCIEKDVIVVDGDAGGLRVLHRRVKNRHVYFIVNERRVCKSLKVSFRDGNQPERWNPETGDAEEISNYMVVDGRVEIPLTLEPWEACYIVLRSSRKDTPPYMISRTDLQGARISNFRKNSVTIEGWRQSDTRRASVEVTGKNGTAFRHEAAFRGGPRPILLDGKWEFVVTPKVLDREWTTKLDTTVIDIPVMRFGAERKNEDGLKLRWNQPGFDDTGWKQIKISDASSKQKGCRRYLSSWDGAWINYYRYDRHWGTLGGMTVHFKRELLLEKNIASARLEVAADKSYELLVNGNVIGSGSIDQATNVFDIGTVLRKGKNNIWLKVDQCRGLLLQGRIKFTDGTLFDLISDNHWLASVDEGVWLPAFPYIYPPLGPWGEIPRCDRKTTFPVVLWYRQVLPTGAKALGALNISGEYEIYVNVKALKLSQQSKESDIGELTFKSNNRKNVLAIKVIAEGYDDGILDPIPVLCGRRKVALGSWTEQGLSWYSGKAVYSNIFDVPRGYLGRNRRLILDLGRVCYCAEIWMNGDLVTYRPWPPYLIEVTDHIRPGCNQLEIVVANLLANQMQWDIHDISLTDLRSRFMHEGAVLRESDCLTSGLLGPVRVIPLQKEKVSVPVL